MTAAHARLNPDTTPPRNRGFSGSSRDASPRAAARSSRGTPHILYLFAGPSRPADGLAAIAALSGVAVTEIDTDQGGAAHDLRSPELQGRVLHDIEQGVYSAVLLATPCTTFAIAHGYHPDGGRHYGWRSQAHPSGPPWLDAAARAKIDDHDLLVAFSAQVLHAALEAGVDFLLENPAPRGDPALDSFWPQRAHIPQIWDTAPLRRFRERAGARAKLMVVPQCAFGPTPSGKLFQKYTGLLVSGRVAARLADLRHLGCFHVRHDDVACGANAPASAAYPTAFNDALVRGLTGVRRTAPLPRAPPAEPALRAEAPPAPDKPPASPDRSISTGYITDGPALSGPVRAEVERARRARRKWASFANMEPASLDELRAAPIPDLLPHAGATTSPGPPSQPGAARRLAEFRARLGRNVAIADLWEPGEWRRFQRWMANERRGASQPSAYFPQESLVPLARGFIWDTRDPGNCVPMEPSDENFQFPGARQIDRRAFCRVAAEVGSRDADIVGQVGRGGVESRSGCALTSELHSHAPGAHEHPDEMAKAVDAELENEWALGPFVLPPTVPIRALPRDVIMQERSRVLDGGAVEDFLKPRCTMNPSRGPDSVNAGIPKPEREVTLTSARDLGYALAVVDVPARDAGRSVSGYAIDMTSAYNFLPVQRLDWWQFAYIWFDARGEAHFRLLVRVGFGGAMSPRRFQSVSVIITAYAKLLQERFDADHPLPPEVAAWQRARRELQRRGELPARSDQLGPGAVGVYLDDLAGGCCDDEVAVPAVLHGVDTASIDLGELSAFAAGGQPLRRSSRAAAHCFCAIAAVRAVGLEVAPGKTEGGDVFVNLGLRLNIREGRIDCPGPKQRILLRDLEDWLARVQGARSFARSMAQRQVGRLNNLTQVMPELLMHMSAGFAAANAGYKPTGAKRRRLVEEVQLKEGSPLHQGLSRLLPHALAVVRRNEGVPLAPRSTFAALHEPGVLLVVSDASGHDGFGGWAFSGLADTSPMVLSARWPEDAKRALEEGKRRPAERTPGAPQLSMPAAELFTAMAVAAAAAHCKPHRAVIAVGDCDPAARALDAASSSTPQMDHLLAAARRRVRQWLGVAVPREWNRDADRLSHPENLDAVLADARAAGLTPSVARTPDDCWAALREAMRLEAHSDE